jgi:hypothetical protein
VTVNYCIHDFRGTITLFLGWSAEEDVLAFSNLGYIILSLVGGRWEVAHYSSGQPPFSFRQPRRWWPRNRLLKNSALRSKRGQQITAQRIGAKHVASIGDGQYHTSATGLQTRRPAKTEFAVCPHFSITVDLLHRLLKRLRRKN